MTPNQIKDIINLLIQEEKLNNEEKEKKQQSAVNLAGQEAAKQSQAPDQTKL